jgi:hypothetical protein
MMNDLDCLDLRTTGHENVKDFEKILSHFCRSCNCAGIFNWQKKNVRGQTWEDETRRGIGGLRVWDVQQENSGEQRVATRMEAFSCSFSYHVRGLQSQLTTSN